VSRSIILLSDGTGNSAAKLFRTNVWRFYQALDLSGTDQIARYDDGVGSSSFKPLAILGGAVGWGLKRNLLDLYMFLCRNYQAGDRIYCVGFSRGAFTIRMLIQFVLNQGLVADFTSETDLRKQSRRLYGNFRREREHTPPVKLLARAVRKIFYDWPMSFMVSYLSYSRDKQLAKLQRKLEKTPENAKLQEKLNDLDQFNPQVLTTIKVEQVPEIRFVGVWDTVDAYGLPVYELKKGIDTFIWSMSLEDRDLDQRITKACHALSIDDKRSTFHPLLWDETDQIRFPDTDHTDDETLTRSGLQACIPILEAAIQMTA
jgi:hypothetical protein